MLPILLLAALASGGDAPSAYHPPDAVFYLELPDVPGLVHAYEGAALLRFLADDEVERFVARIAGEEPEEFRLDEELLEGIDRELSEGGPGFARAADTLLHARSLSISVTVPASATLVGRDENGGAVPPVAWEGVGLLIACTLDETELAAGAAEAFAEFLQSLGPSSARAEESGAEESAGEVREFELLVMGRRVRVWAHTHGATLFFGLGAARWRDLEVRLGAPDATLAADREFLDGRGRFASAGGTPIYESFVRVRGISSMLLSAGLPLRPQERAQLQSIVRFLFPGDAYESHSRTRLIDGRFVGESFRRSSGDTGLSRAFGGAPVSADVFDLLPEGAVAAWVSSIDPSILERELASLLGPSAEAKLEELKARYELDPMQDLIGSLGTRCAVYSHPITGLSASKVHLVVDLDDPAAFERGLRGLARLLADVGEGDVKVGTRPYRNLPLYTFSPGRNIGELAGSLGAPSEVVALAPNLIISELAVTVMGERAIFGLGDMALKTEIKRLLGEESPKPHELAGGHYSFPEDATSVGFVNWGAILKGVYDTLRAFVPLIAQAVEGLPFDPAELPDSGIFTRHFRPTLSWTREVPGGSYRYEESSFGPEIPFALIALAGGGLVAGLIASETEGGGGDVEVRPVTVQVPVDETPPPAADPAEATRERLRHVKLALIVCRTDQGRYPAALDELSQPTERFPQGFLEGESPPCDAWGRALHYETRDDGASFLLWSAGPDGVDAAGAGDDLVSS